MSLTPAELRPIHPPISMFSPVGQLFRADPHVRDLITVLYFRVPTVLLRGDDPEAMIKLARPQPLKSFP